MTWLPLIFVTVINSGVVLAEPMMQPLASSDMNAQEPQLPAAVEPTALMRQEPMQQAALNNFPVEPSFASLFQHLAHEFPEYSREKVIVVDANTQKLYLLEHGQVAGQWIISTAEKGVGSAKGSDQTPLGAHRIAEKIGDGVPLGTIFKSRQNTGKLVEILTTPGADSKDDYVTTRIMWLDGLESGRNKGGNVDSKERFIYIHGTGEEGKLGHPASHGCIRMRNKDVIDLFNQVDENTLVFITDGLKP